MLLGGLENLKGEEFNFNTRTLRRVKEEYFYETDLPSLNNIIVRGGLTLDSEASALKKIHVEITNIGVTGFAEKLAHVEKKTCTQLER